SLAWYCERRGKRAVGIGRGLARSANRAIDLTTREGADMKISEDGQLLRIFIGESDRWHGKPLYEAIILKAREMGIAGATMMRGLMGFGAASRIHTAKILRLSEDLPIVVEIVDSADKIDALVPVIEEMVEEGLITLEKVRVIQYRHKSSS